MDVQFQIRQNAMEMQEYMKDLFDWQKSIKKKERAAAATGASSAQSAPAPRGRATGTVAAAPTDLMQPAFGPKSIPAPPTTSASRTKSADTTNPIAKQNAAAHTYTAYNKWDKFDVDAALASDDEDAKPPTAFRTRTQPNPAASTSGPTLAPSSGAAAPPTKPASAPATPAPSAPSTTGGTSTGQLTPGLPSSPHGLPLGITISASPTPPHAADELLRPVATTRRTVPAAPGASTASSSAVPSSSSRMTPTPPQLQQPDGPAAAGTLEAAAAATSTSAALPPIRNSQPTTADAWRARGNELFKAGEFDSAFECYSRSVEMQPTCLGHANRAMALLKLGRWQEAVSDCTAALVLDPTYTKAYQRRAAAHRQLGATLDAARDWDAALRLEPDNRATAADRQATLETLMSQQKLQPPARRVAVPVIWAGTAAIATSGGGGSGGGSTMAVPFAMGAEGGRLVEQGMGAGGSSSSTSSPSQSSQEVAAVTEGLGTSLTQNPVLQPQAATAAAPSPPPPPTQTAPISPQPTPSPNANTATSTSQFATATAPSSTIPTASSSQPPTVNRSSGGPRSLPGQPRTSVEFEAAWRSLNGQPALQAAYLSGIPPSRLPIIFKNSLTGPMLASILRCLLPAMTTTVSSTAAASEAPAAAAGAITAAASTSVAAEAVALGGEADVALSTGVALLEALTKVPRFDLMAMAVPSRERSELRSVWEALTAALGAVGGSSGGEGLAEGVSGRLAALRPKYRI